jgi:hypothetical protein
MSFSAGLESLGVCGGESTKADVPDSDLNRQLEAYAAVAKSPRPNARRRWGNWPMYAAATGAALAGASAASAEIIYSGPQDLSIRAMFDLTAPSLPIDIDGNNDIFDFAAYNFGAPQRSFFARVNVKFSGVGRSGGVFTSGGDAKIFPSGALISGTRGLHRQVIVASGFRETNCFVSGFPTHPGLRCTGRTGDFGDLAGGFLGVEFNGKTSHGGSGPREFGWIQVALGLTSLAGGGPPAPDAVEVIDWAYNTDGPILAGQTSGPSPVPEPRTLPVMLLAAGAAGVLAWKRRRQSAKA